MKFEGVKRTLKYLMNMDGHDAWRAVNRHGVKDLLKQERISATTRMVVSTDGIDVTRESALNAAISTYSCPDQFNKMLAIANNF